MSERDNISFKQFIDNLYQAELVCKKWLRKQSISFFLTKKKKTTKFPHGLVVPMFSLQFRCQFTLHSGGLYESRHSVSVMVQYI